MTRKQVARKWATAFDRARNAKSGKDKLRKQGEVRAWMHRLMEMEVNSKRRGA